MALEAPPPPGQGGAVEGEAGGVEGEGGHRGAQAAGAPPGMQGQGRGLGHSVSIGGFRYQQLPY